MLTRSATLLILTFSIGACSGADRLGPNYTDRSPLIEEPRGDCYAISAPGARKTVWADQVPAVLELTDRVLPSLRPDEPARYRQARSWPQPHISVYPASGDPFRGWSGAQWRHTRGSQPESGRRNDSLVVDIGPYAVAFEGLTFVVARDSLLRGYVEWHTDALAAYRNGTVQRRAEVTGRPTPCPKQRAYTREWVLPETVR